MRSRAFANNLRAIRERRGLSQMKLARRMGWAHQARISNIERLGVLPQPSTVIRLARALDCRTADLMRDVEAPYDRLR